MFHDNLLRGVVMSDRSISFPDYSSGVRHSGQYTIEQDSFIVFCGRDVALSIDGVTVSTASQGEPAYFFGFVKSGCIVNSSGGYMVYPVV